MNTADSQNKTLKKFADDEGTLTVQARSEGGILGIKKVLSPEQIKINEIIDFINNKSEDE